MPGLFIACGLQNHLMGVNLNYNEAYVLLRFPGAYSGRNVLSSHDCTSKVSYHDILFLLTILTYICTFAWTALTSVPAT